MIVPFKVRQAGERATSPAPRPSSPRVAVELTVEIEAHDSHTKHRRYYKSDDDYTEHRRVSDIYRANEGITRWTYSVPVAEWTGHDVNKLVARALETIAALDDPESTYQPKWMDPYRDPARAGVVKFERRRVGGPHTRIWISSRAKPYYAQITVPGAPIPARAFLDIFQMAEAGANVEVRLTGDTPFGYFPVTETDKRPRR